MQSYAPNTRRLLIIWGILWLLSFFTALGSGFGLAGWLELDPMAILHGNPTAVPGLLGYALVHDPYGILHVAANAWMFYLFAPEVERLYRGRRFLYLLLASAAAGAVITVLLAATGIHAFSAAVVGGSGLVSTVLAVSAAIYPDRRYNLILIQPRLLSIFLVLVGLDLLGFFGQLAGRDNGVATQVHLAGALLGWLWADGFRRFGWSWQTPFRRWWEKRHARQQQRQAGQESTEQEELDRILAKISREGMPSLTAKERSFLEHRSRK